MTLGWKLFLVFLGFLAVLTTVIVMAFRERKQTRNADPNDIAAQKSQDGRVMTIIFTAIVGGMALTLITAYLVFFMRRRTRAPEFARAAPEDVDGARHAQEHDQREHDGDQ